MIKLRTHIISLTAVFLALGIGLVLGSTFLDRTFVDALDAQVKSLNNRMDDRNAEVEALSRVLDEESLTVAAQRGAKFDRLLAGRLADTEVVVLANRGVDEGQVNRMVEVLLSADAEVPAVLWLTERWNPGDDKAASEIADRLGLEPGDDPEEVTAAAADLLAVALAGPIPDADADTETGSTTTAEQDSDTATSTTEAGDQPDSTVAATTSTTTTLPADPEPQELLQSLAEAGLIEPQAAPASELAAPAPEALILSITGEGSLLDPVASYVPVATALVGTNPGRVLIAETRMTRTLKEEALDEGVPDRGESVQAVRDVTSIAGQVSILDGLESPVGKVAAVAALVELGEGKTGDYGMAEGTDGLLPEVGG